MPTINIAPVFKIMNAGGEHSENRILSNPDETFGSNNNEVSFGGTIEDSNDGNSNDGNSNGGNSRADNTKYEEITDKSKIDFNKLVIKKI